MRRLGALVAGEWQRLRKYHLLTANLVLLVIWLLIAAALDEEDLRRFIPFIVLMDAAMMSLVLTGTTIFYERHEHTLNALVVSPVTEDEYLWSKVVTSIGTSLLTLVLLALAMWLVKGVTFSYWSLIPALVVVAEFNALLGIALSYGAKDFTQMLLRAILYLFVFVLPAVFGVFGLIGEDVLTNLLLFPPVSAAMLLRSGMMATAVWQIVFGYLYLSLLSILLYRHVVKPGFQRYVVGAAEV